LSESLLLCDFAKNRTGFRINQVPLEPPGFIRSDRNRAAGAKPSEDWLKSFIKREFPGFTS
jgi:hypothetical protein